VASGQPVGIAPGMAFSMGGNFGWYIDTDSVVQIEITIGNSSYGDPFFERKTIRVGTLGAVYKEFVGNSFYLAGGGLYKTVEFGWEKDELFQIGDSRGSFKGNSIMATFAIGNQWQWDGFTMGCDWVGIAAPLYSKTTSTDRTDLATEDYGKLDDEEQRQLKDIQLYGLRLYVGASF
jgi:hypothetical protein